MGTMAEATTTPDAIELLFGRDESYRWVEDFTLRGRRYTVAVGTGVGCVTQSSNRWQTLESHL